MHHKLFPFAIAGLFLAAYLPMQAQDHDWPRAHRVIEKTQADLRMVEHHDVWPAADEAITTQPSAT